MTNAAGGGFHRIVLLTVVLIMVVTLSTSGDSNEDCSRCHGLFRLFEIVPEGPAEVPVGEDFDVGLIILNHDNRGIHYEIRDITANLSISDENVVTLAPEELTERTHVAIPRGEIGAISWMLSTLEVGEVRINFTLKGTAYFEHESDNPDEATYTIGASLDLKVDVHAVSLSTYSITTFSGSRRSHEMILTAKENVTNVSFRPGGDLAGGIDIMSDDADWMDGYASVGKGGIRTINLTIDSSSEANGVLMVSWTDQHGARRHLNVTIMVIGTPISTGSDVDFLRLAGRISGMIEIPLAAAVIVLGGFPRQLKPRLMKLKKRRLTLHCNISYAMLAIAIFHMAVLLAGPFANVLFSGPMIMGFLALGFLIGLAVNGAAMKFIIKRLGRKYWHHMHVLLSIGFIVTMSFHAYKIGTEFAFLR